MKFYQLLFFSKIFSLNLCKIPQTTGSSCLTTRNPSHYTSPTCLSCLLKRLANGSLPWVSLPCQEASEFLGFRLNASCFHLSRLLSLLCVVLLRAPLLRPWDHCKHSTCLPAFSRVLSQGPCMCLRAPVCEELLHLLHRPEPTALSHFTSSEVTVLKEGLV